MDRIAVRRLRRLEERCRPELPVEPVGPPVVQAADHRPERPARGTVAIDELGTAVLAHVVERMQPIAGPDDDHRLAGKVAHDPVADRRDVLDATDGDPLAEPDSLALGGPHVVAEVGGGRQRRRERGAHAGSTAVATRDWNQCTAPS